MTQIVKSETTPGYVAGTAVVPAQADVAMNIEAAIDRHNLIVKFVEKFLRKDVDYGTVPGIDKPFLKLPGAEKLAAFFGLNIEIQETARAEDWDKPFFAYSHLATLKRCGVIVAQSVGSCNSMEKKYRWRVVWDFKATEDDKDAAHHTETRKDKNAKEHVVYCLANDDIYSQINTLQKMSQKRAIVGAVQIGCSATEFFTQAQDYIDGEFEEVENGSGHAEANAPLSEVDQIIARLQESAKLTKGTGDVSTGYQGALKGKIAECLGDNTDKTRHLVLKRIWGKEHVAELTFPEFSVTANWLIAGKDAKTGDYPLKPEGVREIRLIWRDAQVQAGQMEIKDLFGEEAAQ